MDYAPTLKALSEKRFELDAEGETIGRLKAAMQEQLHRMQIEERQLLKQLEGDPAAGTEWLLRTLGAAAPRPQRHGPGTDGAAPLGAPGGTAAALPAAGSVVGAGQSASREDARRAGSGAVTSGSRADSAILGTSDGDDHMDGGSMDGVDVDGDVDNEDDEDDEEDDDDMDDDVDDDEDRKRLREELLKLLAERQ